MAAWCCSLTNLHLVVRVAGNAEGSADAANLLKPELARRVHGAAIGATTLASTGQTHRKDAALERTIPTRVVGEPNIEDTVRDSGAG